MPHPYRDGSFRGYIDNDLESTPRAHRNDTMQIKDVHAFVKAAELGNLHTAADALGITQPALSKSIRRLETALGVLLFERTARGVALTAIGRVMHERSRSLARQVHDIQTEIADLKTGGSGLIRLGVVPAVVESILAPMLMRFIESRDALRFDIQVQLSAGVLRSLEAGALDLAVAAIPSVLPVDLHMTPLGALRSSVVARQGHPMLRGPFTLKELSLQAWLLPPPDILLSQWATAMFVENGLVPPVVSVQADASPAFFAALVRSTNLLTVLTDDMLHSSMGAGLAALPSPAGSWEIQLGLFWRRKAFFSKAMQDCRRELQQAFAHRTLRRPAPIISAAPRGGG